MSPRDKRLSRFPSMAGLHGEVIEWRPAPPKAKSERIEPLERMPKSFHDFDW
jgi:hypothetical protein